MELEFTTIYINNIPLGEVLLGLFLNWYWLFLPIIFFFPFSWVWLLWRQEKWEKRQIYMFLEMIMPPEVLKPIASMEHVMSNLWSVYSSIQGIKNFKKKWWIGRRLQYFTLEIISDGPHPRFFIRVNREHIDSVKVAFYSQYPEIEFKERREDYTKEISWNLPNKKWNFYGFDQILARNDIYPIKTYKQFFETKPESIKDEKRIDPMNTLLEGFSHLKSNEKLWVQIRVAPVTKKESDYMNRARKLINKLVNRTEKEKKSLTMSALSGIADSVTPVSMEQEKSEKFKEQRELIPSEMKLTPREREIVEAVEKKIGKNMFQVNIRGMYLGENKVFDAGRKSLIEQFFSSFDLPDQNMFGKFRKTKTKILHFIIRRRLYIRKRAMFRKYILRETPLYPKSGGTFVMNTEELATIFHPPVELGKTGVLVDNNFIKKGSAPSAIGSVIK